MPSEAAEGSRSAMHRRLRVHGFPVESLGGTIGDAPRHVGQATLGQATLGQATLGQATLGQATFGQATFGQATFGQATFGQAAFGQPACAATSVSLAVVIGAARTAVRPAPRSEPANSHDHVFAR